MEKKFFTEEELESLRGGLNESPVISENEKNDEEDGGALICCVGNATESLQ